jgi:hypothetical protein
MQDGQTSDSIANITVFELSRGTLRIQSFAGREMIMAVPRPERDLIWIVP